MKVKRTWMTAIALVTLCFAGIAQADASTFTLRRGGGSRINFVSNAPLERMTGVNNAVTGELTVDPTNLSSASGRVVVDMTQFRTGIDLRDEHLRGSDWMDAEQFPTATFEISSVEGASALTQGEVTRATLHGRFTMHGQSREITAPAQIRWIAAEGDTPELIRAVARFSVELADYGVVISTPVRLKVANEIEINVTIRAVKS